METNLVILVCTKMRWNTFVTHFFSFKVCEDLVAPDFGQVSVDGTGLVATYTCDVGYTLDGDRSRDCQSDGASWTGSSPTCGKIYITRLSINSSLSSNYIINLIINNTFSFPIIDLFDFKKY